MLFEVIKRPDGPAPEEIRDTWIGLTLEADIFPVAVKERSCWKVPFDHALRVLSRKSEKAAEWYRQNYPEGTRFIAFGCDETKVVEWSSK